MTRGPATRKSRAPEPVRETAEARREGEQDEGRGEKEEAGLEGRVADDGLEEENEEEGRAREGAVDEQGRDVDEGEVVIAKEEERKERVPCPELAHHEGREGDTSDGERPGDRGEALLPSLHDPVRHETEPEGDERSSEDIEPGGSRSPGACSLLARARRGRRRRERAGG